MEFIIEMGEIENLDVDENDHRLPSRGEKCLTNIFGITARTDESPKGDDKSATINEHGTMEFLTETAARAEIQQAEKDSHQSDLLVAVRNLRKMKFQ